MPKEMRDELCHVGWLTISYQRRASWKLTTHFSSAFFEDREFHRTHVHNLFSFFFLLSFNRKKNEKKRSIKKNTTFGSWESHRESLRIQYMRWKDSLLLLCSSGAFEFLLCCYFSLYLNNIEIFCKKRREAQKRRSRRPRRRKKKKWR